MLLLFHVQINVLIQILILLNLIYFLFNNEIDILKSYLYDYLWNNPFDFLALISCIFPILSCCIYFNTIWENSKIIVFYVALIFFLEIIGGYYSAHKYNNHIIYLLFYFFETLCLFIFYQNSIKFNKINQYFKFITIVVLLGIVYNIINSSSQLNDYSTTIQSLGFLIIALLSYYYLLFIQKVYKLSNSSLFWINSGVFIYFAGSFFVSLFNTKILSSKDLSLSYLYDIVAIPLIIFRLFLAIGISKIKYNKSQWNLK